MSKALLALGLAAVGGAGFLAYKKYYPSTAAPSSPVPGQPGGPRLDPLNPTPAASFTTKAGEPFKIGDKVIITTQQPNGSLANLTVLVVSANGTTLTVSPADSPPYPPEAQIVYPQQADVSTVVQKA